MGLMDQFKSTVGGAVSGAAKDENIKNTVKSSVSGAVNKIAAGKVDQNTVNNTVNTVVDEAAKLADKKDNKENAK